MTKTTESLAGMDMKTCTKKTQVRDCPKNLGFQEICKYGTCEVVDDNKPYSNVKSYIKSLGKSSNS